jgi:ubiquinone/menaquinone biosynthesis C-methylase UbiE
MGFDWPEGFARVPDEEWTRTSLESLALKYDTVEAHGWYRNLELTIEQLVDYVRDGQILIDYSGGTGILVDRFLRGRDDLAAAFVIVDASPKFLRLALEKLGGDPRVGFRWIRYLKPEKRLELLDEVFPAAIRDRGVDGLISTNAIHLYYDLSDTLLSWFRILRPGARTFVQSGNINSPGGAKGEWIIDETVEAIHTTAAEIVRTDSRYAAYRSGLDDAERVKKYDRLRQKFFVPVRSLDYYLAAFRDAGFSVDSVEHRSIEAKVAEWYDFLAVYHEGVLGWVGGTKRIEGADPSEQAVADRLTLMREAMERLFGGASSFPARWTYIVCTKP